MPEVRSDYYGAASVAVEGLLVIDQEGIERPSKGLVPLGSQRTHMKIERKISNTITIATMMVTFFLGRKEEEF